MTKQTVWTRRCRTLDSVGHLAQIDRVLDLSAAALRLDNDGVVELDAVIARRDEFRVEVEYAHGEMGVPARHHFEHLLRAVGVIVLAVVKIGQDDIVLQAPGDRLQLWRRGKAPADGGVEMRVVPIEGDVCKECQAEGSANDAEVGKARQPTAQMERQAQGERENQQHRRAPGAEIEDVGESVVD